MSINSMNFLKEKSTKLLINSVHNAGQSVQIECVLRILTNALEQINLSIILPQILENASILPQILGGTEYQKVISMVNEFVKRCTYIKFEKSSFLDHKLVQLFDYLQENHKMFSLLPSDWSLNMDTDDRDLVEAIKVLYELTVSHIYTSPQDEISKERKLHKLYNDNESMRACIDDMQKKFSREKLNLRWKILAKEAYMQKCYDHLKKKRLYHRFFVRLFKKNLIRELRTFHRLNAKRNRNLRNEVVAAKQRFEMHLKTRKITMMEAYERRKDAMHLLQDKIKMYDRNMAMKIVKKLDLQKTLVQITDRNGKFEVAHSVEMRECEKYEEEEQEKLEYSVTNFVINRAAKKIQRYWCDYRERRIEIERKLTMDMKKRKQMEMKERKSIMLEKKMEKKIMMEKERELKELERKEMKKSQMLERKKLQKWIAERKEQREKMEKMEKMENEKNKKIKMRLKNAKKMEKEVGKIEIKEKRHKLRKEKMAKGMEEKMSKDEIPKQMTSKANLTREEGGSGAD